MRDNELDRLNSSLHNSDDQLGEPGEDIDKWLKSFVRTAKAHNWTEKRQCDILPAFFRDRAAEYYDSEKYDFESLKFALTNYVMPKEAQ